MSLLVEPAPTRLRRLHLVVGFAGLAAFLLSGQYMHHVLGHLKGLADAPRLLYRTSHIYLMWAALLNLLLGIHLRAGPDGGWRRHLHRAGSAAILAAPAWIGASFMLECWNATLARPLCRTGIYLAFGGVLVQAAAGLAARRAQAARGAAPSA